MGISKEYASELERALREKILILDGALGTEIQKIGIEKKVFDKIERRGDIDLSGCNDLLNICSPETIEKIHLDYLEAGADIIETNTFNANAVSLKEYGMEHLVAELNRAAVETAKRAVEKSGRKAWIAGSVGPTNMSLSLSLGDVDKSFQEIDELGNAYYEQIFSLIKAGVDLIIIETVFDTLNAKTAIAAYERAREKSGRNVPVMLSCTLTEAGRTLSGQTIEAFAISVAHARPLAIGLNCGFGAEALIPYIEKLQNIPFGISIYPNAGLPNAAGEYDESPEEMAKKLQPLLEDGKVNIVGGCCGTTPAHIGALAQAAHGLKPREIPEPDGRLHLSGLEAMTVGNEFVKVGERCNVAGSRKFLRLIKERSFAEATKIAEDQVEGGARIIDINMDDALLNPLRDMTQFVGLISLEPSIARVPFMIDTSDWNVVAETLKLIQGKPVVNSISLKEGEKEFLEKAKHIHRSGAAMVVMAFDEKSQADTFERKIEVCERAYRLLTEVGIPPEDIIFDPNILAIATGIESHDRYGVDFIEATAWIKRHLPGAKVSGGLSNLSFSFRGNNPVRESMHASFLEHAIPAGMDMAIVNPSTKTDTRDIEPRLKKVVEDAVLNTDNGATERLAEFASKMMADKQPTAIKVESKSKEIELNPCEALKTAIVRGKSDGLKVSLEEAVAKLGGAMKTIDGPLMDGMNEVGRLFGEGKMFLPQVVKSAQTMQKAVEILKPLIDSEVAETGRSSAGKMVLATVKGDVHDIGKNIVAIIMRCNGFDVLDLGVMVEGQRIIDTAIKEKADLIGLSGLITPSLNEMTQVARLMESAGLNIPLFVGGAAASELHTALKIAPAYGGCVVYTKDAASLPGVVQKFLSPSIKEEASTELKNRQEKERQGYYSAHEELVSLEEARKKKHKVKEGEKASSPKHPGTHTISVPLEEIRDLINWRQFFSAWKLDANFAELADIKGCDHCRAQWLAAVPRESRMKAAEAMQLFKESNRMLDRWTTENANLRARVSLLPSYSEGDDIIVHTQQGTVKIPTLRQQIGTNGDEYLSLADFITETDDNIGFFVVSIAGKIDEYIRQAETNGDSYKALLAQSLADRLVEAASEWIHRLTALDLWGYADDEKKIGIRPAVGYPSLPDQSLIFLLDKILDYAELGITVTENGALQPSSTVSGLIIGNIGSRYFSVGSISEESKRDYAARRGLDLDTINRFLPK